MPFLLKTLQSLQIFFTDERTFMILPLFLPGVFRPECYPAACQVVRRKLNCYSITGQDLDKMHAHFPGDMSQHPMAIIQFYPEHGIRQRFNNRSLYLDRFFFGHKVS